MRGTWGTHHSWGNSLRFPGTRATRLEAAGVIRLQEQINPGHGRVRIVEPAAKRFELIASF